jgi:hypothetical protein
MTDKSMMHITDNNRNDEDDVDLIGLVERASRYFRKYGGLYIAAIIAGVGLGILFSFVVRKEYRSQMILHSSYLTNPEQIQIVDNWSELLKRHEYDALAEIFHCRQEVVKKLSYLDAQEIQKVFTPNNPNGFYIDVRVEDNDILPELQSGIVYGLSNTEYIRQRTASKKENLTELMAKVDSEIKKLDSIKATIRDIINNKEKNSSSLLLDVSGVNRQWVDLNEKMIYYKDELRFSNGVQVLEGFNKFTAPVSPGWKILTLLCLIVALVITYLYTLYRYVSGKLKQRSQLPGKISV